MKISIEEIRLAVSLALDNYTLINGGGDIEVDEDLYWFVPDECLFDTGEKPSDLAIGSLVDDVASIRRDLSSDDALGSVSMQQAAALLIWLSAKAGSPAVEQ